LTTSDAATEPRRFILPCGLPVVIEAMPSCGSVAVSWLLPLGDSGDHPSRQGEAAILSELALRGCGDLDSRGFSDALDRLGVQRSLSNGNRHLRLGATMLGDRLNDALPLLVDLIRRPRLPADALDAVRSLCLQSLESLEDEPQRLAMLRLAERHQPSPFNRTGFGDAEGLRAIRIDHLRTRWARDVRPGGSILAIAGRVDPEAIERRLAELLEGWHGAAPEPSELAPPARGTIRIPQDSAQVHLGIALDAPPARDRDAMAWSLAIRILGGGSSSRLFVELREKRGLCYSVAASAAMGRDRGIVSIYAGSTPQRIAESRNLILDGLADMSNGIEEAEFRRASVALRRSLLAQSESTTSRAAQLASDVDRLGKPRSLADVAREAAEVDLDRLRAFTRDRLDLDWIEGRSEVHLGPTTS
jgi:predicted Zn-dependent peptidase